MEIVESFQPDVGFVIYFKQLGDDAGKIIGVYKPNDKLPLKKSDVGSINITDYIIKKGDTIISDLKNKRINWKEVPLHRKTDWLKGSQMLEWAMIRGYLI
jgi:hypothetical protein